MIHISINRVRLLTDVGSAMRLTVFEKYGERALGVRDGEHLIGPELLDRLRALACS